MRSSGVLEDTLAVYGTHAHAARTGVGPDVDRVDIVEAHGAGAGIRINVAAADGLHGDTPGPRVRHNVTVHPRRRDRAAVRVQLEVRGDVDE
jgi:hypothetical protein